MSSVDDRRANLRCAASLVAAASADGAELVVLPEMFSVQGLSNPADRRETIDGPTVRWARKTASDYAIWLIAGSFAEIFDVDHHTNTVPVISPEGKIAATYRKIHLFDNTLPGAEYRESAHVHAGDITSAFDCESTRIGLAVCYDLRFPELFRRLIDDGVRIIALPSAFTLETGKAHWEVLLRARAIENQAYVLAPNQCGTISGIELNGNSMIVGPWGDILGEAADDRDAVVTCDLDLAAQDDLRHALPVLDARRLS